MEKPTKKPANEPDEFLIPDFEDMLEADDVGEVIPTMNVQPAPMETEADCIVEDGVLLGLYDEIIVNCRVDREKVDEIQNKFEDMVINDGDASSASKEALVNLMKIKTDINDKMAKVADLMTRVKLRDRDTFKPYLAVSGKPNAVSNKKAIISAIQEKRRKEAASG